MTRNERNDYGASQRWVIKVGSSLVTNNGQGLAVDAIAHWADQIAQLSHAGKEIVLVSSGAVAAGMARLGWQRRPHALHELQAAAAVGQMGLVQTYEVSFARHQRHAAQVLLTYADLSDRRRYLNARSTLRTLMQLGVIPVVNENDTVSTEELRFGDNDTLASLVANLVEAELLIILTDQQGLFDKDPRQHSDAQLIGQGHAEDKAFLQMATPAAGTYGRGGMYTKITAAARAAQGGAATWIACGREPDILLRMQRGESVGTLLVPSQEPLAARKRWISGHLQVKGYLHLDQGAARVIRESGRSLLPIGVMAVDGDFQRGDVVGCKDEAGIEIARGLVNYSAQECRQIVRLPSHRLEEVLGYVDEPEVIHRDNMVIL